MTDIVKRLRDFEAYVNPDPGGIYEGLPLEAADEIERLHEQIASLQASSGYEASIAQLEIERLQSCLYAQEDVEPLYDEIEVAAGTIRALTTEIERLRAESAQRLKTQDLLAAEIERLRTQCGGNCRYWEGRWRDEAKENERLRATVPQRGPTVLSSAGSSQGRRK